MTAEIAILNRSAVALAADSAVTVETYTATKTYHTVNKLFTLSKYHPVGVMIYNNADFMDIPWETIIKLFRKKIKDEEYSTIKEYSNRLIRFIENELPSPDKRQIDRVYGIWSSHFEILDIKITHALRGKRQQKGQALSQAEVRDITKATIKKERDRLSKRKYLEEFKEVNPEQIVQKYEKPFKAALEDHFRQRKITNKTLDYLREIAGYIIVKNDFSPVMSGVVVAGFGKDEYFPSLQHFETDGIVDGKLVIQERGYEDISREPNERATIIPFAQGEMVARFMDGIDPEYLALLERSVVGLMTRFSDFLMDKHATGSAQSKAAKKRGARQAAELMVGDLLQKHEAYRQREYVQPVMHAVQILPREEMAEMAEALVSLTSLKRRISLDADTVGGPIDVAVISKGDGFIWIKRKHYFDPELNPHFLRKYFHEGPERENDDG